jgi:hypothetical protein
MQEAEALRRELAGSQFSCEHLREEHATLQDALFFFFSIFFIKQLN